MPKYISDISGNYILISKGEYMSKVEDVEGNILQVPSEQVDDNTLEGEQVAFREPPCQKCNSERLYDQSKQEYYCPVCHD